MVNDQVGSNPLGGDSLHLASNRISTVTSWSAGEYRHYCASVEVKGVQAGVYASIPSIFEH